MAEEERSIEDRVADHIFGEEPDVIEEPEASDDVEEIEEELDEEPEDQDEPVAASEEYEEIEVDGEILQVPPKYKDYFLRQADYTKKTQEVAAQRAEVETRMAAIEQERRQYEFVGSVQDDLNRAYALDAEVGQYREYLKNNIDNGNLSSQDILKIQMAIEEKNTEKSALTQSLQKKYQDFQQAQEQSLKELLQKSTETLRAKIPGWGEQSQREIRDYALKAGFTEQEVGNVYDPRYVEVLYKAAQYDKLKANAKGAVKKVADAPAIKPKSRNPMPDNVKRKLNMRKKLQSNRSAAEKADIIREDLADRLGL